MSLTDFELQALVDERSALHGDEHCCLILSAEQASVDGMGARARKRLAALAIKLLHL